MDTFLGEQGALLSGGEKQKIGIARAILKKSLLYIFDEPASFLDLKTEKGKKLKKKRKGKEKTLISNFCKICIISM